MDELGGMNLEDRIRELGEAIRNLSEQLQKLQQTSLEEAERLEKYAAEGDLLDFTLVTGGLIRGKILWVGNQSLEIETDSGQNIILYKHAIAFVEKQSE